jgi:pimeloyl-ACP methyl ester carboxylesterase
VLPPGELPIRSVYSTEPVSLITYDRRCCGRSEYTLEHFALEDLAADAAGLLDHLGIQRAIVVGSSAGGPIALLFALLWPDRVIGLALPNTGPGLMCEPPLGYGDPLPQSLSFRLQRVRSFQRQVEGARAMGDRPYFETQKEVLRDPPVPPGSVATDQEREQLRQALFKLEDDQLFLYNTGMLRNYEAYAGRDFTERLGELRMPVFLVHGSADQAVPVEYMEDLARGISHAESHLIEGAGHGILDHPEAQRLLREWTRRVTLRV